MTSPTESSSKDPLLALQEAIANISVESWRSSYQQRPLQIPGDHANTIDADPPPNDDEDSIPQAFKVAVAEAYALVDEWEKNGHPSQRRDPDPVKYELELETFTPGPGDIIVDDSVWKVEDYFGEEWSDIIVCSSLITFLPDADMIQRNLNAVEPFESDMLDIELFPHQKRGVAKILELFKGPFYGGILGDEMGLGKTLMAIAACLVDREQQKRRGCFMLVVAPLSTHSQWAKECKHFKPVGSLNGESVTLLTPVQEYRPVPFVLDDPDITAGELLEKDVDLVIVTPQFLESQYRKWTLRDYFMTLVAEEGWEAACKKHPLGKDGAKPINLSLYSAVYANRLLPITHVIVDEAHYGKDTEGSTHKAIKRLYRTCTLFLSGTFMSNRWDDIFALIDLLPSHPFDTKADFERTFGNDSGSPLPAQFNILVKFLQAIVIARPNSVLQLKDATIIDHPFRLSEDDEDEVYFQMILWYRAMQRLGYKKDTSAQEAKDASQRALQLVNRAQVCAGHSLASDSLVSREQRTRQQVEEAIKTFKERYDAAREQHAYEGPTEPSLITYDQRVRRTHTFFQEKLIKVAGIVPETYKPTKKNSKTREDWLKFVPQLYKDGTIWSARVKAIYKLIENLRKTKPKEKIVIFSKYLKFLDLLAEVFAHMENQPSVYRFDGQLGPVRREITRFMFSKADEDDFSIMLVTAGAGGAGINLSAASIVIQCEVWWNMNDERQAWFRLRRPEQGKEVVIYRLFAENSLVDYHIQMVRDAKAEVIDKFMEKLRREDDEEPEIPLIVPYGFEPTEALL
jgi:SNF2 family DNA or RNA helicase